MKRYLNQITIAVLFLSICAFSVPAVVHAASATISKSYEASGTVVNNSLVSLVKGNTNEVESANLNNASRLIGVAVQSNESLLEVNPSSSTIQVATDGTVIAMVSTVNGSIAVGNDISTSPFDGVGMKSAGDTRIIGQALTSFNGTGDGVTSLSVTDKQGKQEQIKVGLIKINISVGTDAGGNSTENSLQRFFTRLLGHPISMRRILLAIAVAFIALVLIVTLTYTSIYGTIISVGRNPLAKYEVFRTLASVLGMTFLVALVAAVAIYLLLS